LKRYEYIICGVALAALLACLILWYSDGMRLGFWRTSSQLIVEVPVIVGMPELGTQQKVTWEKGFVSGIETPTIGLIFSASLISYLLLRRRHSK
tara:strand:+ start:1049 stop:1330 length:282 start_codon:yes stop_codon:yes gene_type:complete